MSLLFGTPGSGAAFRARLATLLAVYSVLTLGLLAGAIAASALGSAEALGFAVFGYLVTLVMVYVIARLARLRAAAGDDRVDAAAVRDFHGAAQLARLSVLVIAVIGLCVIAVSGSRLSGAGAAAGIGVVVLAVAFFVILSSARHLATRLRGLPSE
jgi:hypothetical protein